jgi:hypothetical protein
MVLAMTTDHALAASSYQCVGADGRTEFRQTPCPSGSRTVAISAVASPERPPSADARELEERRVAATRTPPPTASASGEGKITLKFPEATLQQMMRVMSDFIGLAYTIDPGVDVTRRANVDIYNQPAAEVLRTLESTFQVRIVRDERVMRVMKVR